MEDNIKNMLKECVYSTPLTLTVITQKESIDYINKALPYSTGFEIECPKSENWSKENFTNIPDIMEYKFGEEDGGEHKFRIPNGIAGLVCLYNISEQLKDNCELNPASGIHYHIDMTDCFHLIKPNFVRANSTWILEELDSWGDYLNKDYSRECRIDSRCWVQFQSGFKTCEIRIGEMTFDYELLVKRIIHCNNIVRKLKLKLLGNSHSNKIIYQELDNDKIIKYINNISLNIDEKINNLKSKYSKKESENELKELSNIVNSRLIKI